MNWISVKERLPEKNTPVLISIAPNETAYKDWDNMQVAYYLEPYDDMDKEDSFWQGVGRPIIGDVTHWMSLPEKPKD